LNNSAIKIQFKDFKYSDATVNGQIIIKFDGFTEDQNPEYRISISKLELSYSDNTEFLLQANEKLVFLKGFYTISSTDDVLRINYKAEGIDRNGAKFKAAAHDLIFDFQKQVNLPISGTKVLHVNNSFPRIFYLVFNCSRDLCRNVIFG
jgi:phage-related protein